MIIDILVILFFLPAIFLKIMRLKVWVVTVYEV